MLQQEHEQQPCLQHHPEQREQFEKANRECTEQPVLDGQAQPARQQ